MPADFTGLLIALALWIGGTGYAYDRIRTGMRARHDAARDGPLPAVRPIFWTMLASIALAAAGFFLIWLFDRATGRA